MEFTSSPQSIQSRSSPEKPGAWPQNEQYWQGKASFQQEESLSRIRLKGGPSCWHWHGSDLKTMHQKNTVQSANTIKSIVVPVSKKSYFYFLIHLPGKQHHPNACVGTDHHVVGAHMRRAETKEDFFPMCPKVSWHLGQQRPSILSSVCCCLRTEPAKCAAEPKRGSSCG